MARDLIRYDLLVQNALRSVVRDVLKSVKDDGLPGEHHFYIAFRTDLPGVEISSQLRELYPEEITIVLQHQFWDLDVGEDHFQVRLSFNNIPEMLVVPFSAIRGFFDPSVQFGLQFEPFSNLTEDQNLLQGDASSVLSLDAPDAKEGTLKEAELPDSDKTQEDGESAQEGADIVRLDTFRKKNQ